MKIEFLYTQIIVIQAVVYVSALQIDGKAVDYAQYIFLGATMIAVGLFLTYNWRQKNKSKKE